MTQVNILGDVGSGKTLLATYFASKVKDRPIMANYKLNLPNFEPLTVEKLFKINYPCVVILDEAYIYLESRMSMRNINMGLSYIRMQSRKRGIDFILTEQLLSMLDIRFRKMINIQIECELTEEGFQYTVFRPGYYEPSVFILSFEEAEKIYPLYDTFEMITPIDDNLLPLTQSKEDFREQIEQLAQQLLKVASCKEWTKGTVEDYFLENDLPENLCEKVYHRIKAKGKGKKD